MKKQYNIIILVLIVFVSCSKEFTELAPISERNAENFYNTSSDMEVAVNAIYNTLKANGTYNQSYWILQELRSANTDVKFLVGKLEAAEQAINVTTNGDPLALCCRKFHESEITFPIRMACLLH